MGFSHVSCFVFAGRRCLCPEWLGDLLIVHHHGQHSLLCACSRSKLPIAPMGKLLTGLPRLSLAQLRPTLPSNSGSKCHRELEKFPSPRWESCLLACPDSRLHDYFGQLQPVRATETLQSSHRLDGIFTCLVLVLAGRRCLHPRWHGDLVIMHHHWQHSLLCACSRSKFPIAPMGKC